ncbi:unnamed protein product [Soboliphyme baturini]|uniref:CTLH domain-containing protein n=1 Tax=Soboliphyme baturini TaxID=241478 RepID=A0A183IQK4_9BILA|nr:unnamed protein product [Soboliphyme baturini]
MPYVEEKYKQFLRTEGDVDALASVDLPAAVQLLIHDNRWEKALEMMKQQKKTDILSTYLMRWIQILVEQNEYRKAFEAVAKHDLQLTQENAEAFSSFVAKLYVFQDPEAEMQYWNWASLRDALLHMMKQTKSLKSVGKSHVADVLEKHLLISHLYSLYNALSELSEDGDVGMIRSRISVSLLRYTDVISADKAFYEAGVDCRKLGGKYQGMAFVLLNHFLDIAEAIEENSLEAIDFVDFEGTDIPQNIVLPKTSVISRAGGSSGGGGVMALDFNRYFWGEKHNGFAVLYRNMKHGQLCSAKELHEFLKLASVVEEEYYRHLSKLIKQLSAFGTEGSVVSCSFVRRCAILL